MSYLALATACAMDIEHPACDLLGLSGRALADFQDQMRDGACMDLQEAIDQAWDSGEVGLPGQMELRIAA